MNQYRIITTLAIVAAILLVGYLFIEYNTWLGYTESAILFLAAVIGGGCYWIGSNK